LGSLPVQPQEMFAGAGAANNAWVMDGYSARGLDKKYASNNDINSDLGFANHIMKTLQTELAALGAPVCSTWGGMNRGTSRRTTTRPQGNSSLACVADANLMATRVILLMWILASMGVCIFIEQPVGSLMEKLPRFIQFMLSHKLWRKKIDMSDCCPPPMR
jgi:hypothetical protein